AGGLPDDRRLSANRAGNHGRPGPAGPGPAGRDGEVCDGFGGGGGAGPVASREGIGLVAGGARPVRRSGGREGVRTVDLNADLGEGSPGEEALFATATSVNIACGGHAGDESDMRAALR